MLIKRNLGIDVVQASKERIKAIFANGTKVRLSFSGGKDSIVLADIVYKMCLTGEITPSKLEVIFVDEEAMYDDVIEIVEKWRIKFISIGVKFSWYCIEVRHFNCLNSLANDLSFICWDRNKKDVWVRPMPKNAITTHPLLIPRKDTYQDFLSRLDKAEGVITLIGIRLAESIQRLKNFAKMKSGYAQTRAFPIYDMLDNDVWLYIKNNNLELPKAYENLYRVGTPVRMLRLSQFFSIDTARALVKLNEIYPDLMEKVTRREPNAYLASMYWDSEMFGRNTTKRKKLEQKDGDKKNYKALLFELFDNPDKLDSEDKKSLLNRDIKKIVALDGIRLKENHYKQLYQCVIAGDPKRRTLRGLIVNIYGDLSKLKEK